MAEANDEALEAPVKKSKLPLILGLVLALAGGGGGFAAVSSGLLPIGGAQAVDDALAKTDKEAEMLPETCLESIRLGRFGLVDSNRPIRFCSACEYYD